MCCQNKLTASRCCAQLPSIEAQAALAAELKYVWLNFGDPTAVSIRVNTTSDPLKRPCILNADFLVPHVGAEAGKGLQGKLVLRID